MKAIPLGRDNNCVSWVDDEDFEELSQYEWRRSAMGYAIRSEGASRTIWMHRVIVDCPDGKIVDHINGDKLMNVRSNLRICTQTENKRNVGKKSNNTSGYKGVTWSKSGNKWIAQIGAGGQHRYLGYFDDPLVAAKIYKAAEVWFYGQFAPASDTPGEMQDCMRLWIESERAVKRLEKTSPYRGVIWDRRAKKWSANITSNYRSQFLGNFRHVVLAAAAYNDAAVEIFGADAQINEFRVEDLQDYVEWKNTPDNSNLQPSNTSGYTGVSFYRASGRWLAYVGVGGGRISLGYFDSKEEAAYVVDQARLQVFPATTTFNVLDKEVDA